MALPTRPPPGLVPTKAEPPPVESVGVEMKKYLLTKRESLLIELAAIEELLGLPRSVPARRKRQRANA